MASPLLDGYQYIRTSILPSKFSRTPSITPPFDNNTRSLNVLETLKESLKYFDKDSIRLAAFRSYKVSPVKVGGASRTRESVYDTELMGILSNWLQGNYGWSVTGQWHLRNPPEKSSSRKTRRLFWSYSRQEIKPLYNRTSRRHPSTCPFSLQMRLGWSISPVKMIFIHSGNPTPVHFSHDLNFTRVLMNARFKNEAGRNVKEIKDGVVAI